MDIRQDIKIFPETDTFLTPVPTAYAGFVSWLVIYFPYSVLLSCISQAVKRRRAAACHDPPHPLWADKVR